MYEANFVQIKKAIESANKIAILPNIKKKEDSFASAQSLFLFLKNLKKDVSLIDQNNPANSFFPTQSKQNRFIISLDKDISQIYYKKENSKIKLYFTPKNQKLKPTDFKLISVEDNGFLDETSKNESDLLFVLGFKNFQEIEEAVSVNGINPFFQAKIINIDNTHENEKFGEINLVEPSLTLTNIIEKLIENLTKNKNFSLPIKELGLFKKVVERFRFSKELGVYFSYLKKDDFQETKTDSSDLKEVINKIKINFDSPDFFIFWESAFSNPEPRIFGAFYLKNEDLAEKISKKFPTQRKGKSGLFLINQNNIELLFKKFLEDLK